MSATTSGFKEVHRLPSIAESYLDPSTSEDNDRKKKQLVGMHGSCADGRTTQVVHQEYLPTTGCKIHAALQDSVHLGRSRCLGKSEVTGKWWLVRTARTCRGEGSRFAMKYACWLSILLSSAVMSFKMLSHVLSHVCLQRCPDTPLAPDSWSPGDCDPALLKLGRWPKEQQAITEGAKGT